MSYTKTEDLFSRNYLCDKKHKTNTSPKQIPASIINEIERQGLTLERIEELNAKGYDIYKYATQITLHGECKELSNNGEIGGYKSIVLNKNKSIGIKWIAVDNAKKHRIINMLSECGWSSESNSTSLHPTRIRRVNDADEARRVADEWKSDIERIDHSLFYGTSSIFLARSPYGGVYVVCNLIVNGIKECNVDRLIEQATGKSIEEIESIRAKRMAEEKAKRDEWNARYEAEQAERRARASEFNEKFVADLRAGYTEAVSTEVKVGTVVAVVGRDYDGKYELKFYRIEKRTAKPCHEDGSDNWMESNNQKLVKKPCKCFIKKTA